MSFQTQLSWFHDMYVMGDYSFLAYWSYLKHPIIILEIHVAADFIFIYCLKVLYINYVLKETRFL